MQTHDPETQRSLREVVDRFSTGMLVTLDHEGRPRARPMAVVQHEGAETLWFVTSADSDKVSEVHAENGKAAVTLQSSTAQVSLSGRARVVDDAEVLEQLWSPSLEAWFPDGPKASGAVALKFEADHGEYWDVSGLTMVRYALNAAKAWARSESVAEHTDEDDTHGATAL